MKRLRASVLKLHTAATISTYIEEETTLGMMPFSFKDHEYQIAVLNDTSKESNTQKCSQIGISECTSRKALGLVNVLQPYTVCYTLPTAKFAATYMKTRIDPIIQGSKVMREKLNYNSDNQEYKQFGDSFLYLKGAAISNAPISIPVDHLIHDEVDFSDQEVLGQYTSRLTHSKHKRVDRFSTPTLPNFGINKFFRESRRHYLMVKCHHCNFWFTPDYYRHVKIPEYTGELEAITKHTLTRVRWEEAALHCPKCNLTPSLQWEHREWVCENPDEHYIASGRQITPFDAPNTVSCADLVRASTTYARNQDFVNFNLGLPAEDRDSTLMVEDFEGRFYNFELASEWVYVMGIDVGNTYHFVVAGIAGDGSMHVVHREQVPMGNAKTKYDELRVKWRVVCAVIDSMPHSETVMALQALDVNLYASVYMRSKSLLTHNVLERPEAAELGKKFIRQVNVNRSRAFDAYMDALRSGKIHIRAGEDQQMIIQHHTSMKRVKTYDSESGELGSSWQKTDGEDHYHHAFNYCWIAGQIRGVGKTTIIIPTTSIFTFRPRNND